MKISDKSWAKYIEKLRKVNDTAADKMLTFLDLHRDEDGLWNSPETRELVLEYAYGLSVKYGEAAAELACEMYDMTAEVSNVSIPAAEPAATATYGEVAKAVNGTMKTANEKIVAQAVSRLVKMVSVDTVMQNALRDGAEWAWIPRGDTCAFCITLASRGWQKASRKALKNGHAEHIHANCDCTYGVRFDKDTEVEGYDPDDYLEMYETADGATPADRINALRRQHYARNEDRINAKKRAAWALKLSKNKLLNRSDSSIISARGQGAAGLKRLADPAERSKVIREANNSKQPIYAEELRKAYNGYHVQEVDNLYDVSLHGSSKYTEYEHTYILDTETLAYMISGRRDYHGDDIRLLSCSTGKADEKGDCVAQQLADILRVRIKAPIDILKYNPDGSLTVGRKNLSEEDGFRWFDPR